MLFGSFSRLFARLYSSLLTRLYSCFVVKNPVFSSFPGRGRRLQLLLLLTLFGAAACRPDQIEHLKDSKRNGIEAANWEVKRIMPNDLLRATRWAGDSLTAFADTLLRRTLARQLAGGGLSGALSYCRPETYAATDSMARVLQATPSRVSARPRDDAAADTLRQVSRPGPELFAYQRSIVLNDALCLRCHGEVGKDITRADYALIQKAYPRAQATGYRLGQTMGAWRVSQTRDGVAEFYTMKTRKKWKPRKQLPKLF